MTCQEKKANELQTTSLNLPIDGSLSEISELTFHNTHYGREVMLFFYLNDC